MYPGRAAARQFGVVHPELQAAGRDVDADAVTAVDQGDRAALRRLRADVADAQAGGAAAEAADV